ncbi:MAG: pseudouridine synthase [Spongiibacteraceae bacterium]
MAKIILLNKPFNVLCQFTDADGRSTLADFVTLENVYPAGRLDYDSEGLVILTDDGKIQHQISHPKAKLSKTYWVEIEGEPREEQLDALRKGAQLNDGPCRPAKVKTMPTPAIWARTPPVRIRKNKPTSWLEIVISEGRNRQVRRMTASIGFPTLRLIRVAIGEWSIGQLQPGQTERITVHSAAAPARKQPQRSKLKPQSRHKQAK